jgi:hypothetical protein
MYKFFIFNNITACAQASHLQRATTPDAMFIQFHLLRMKHVEECNIIENKEFVHKVGD